MWIKLLIDQSIDPEHVDKIEAQLSTKRYRTERESDRLLIEGGDILYHDIGDLNLCMGDECKYQLNLVDKTTFKLVPCLQKVIVDVSGIGEGARIHVKTILNEWEKVETCIDEGSKLLVGTHQDRETVAHFLSFLRRYNVTCSKGREKRVYVKQHSINGLAADMKLWGI